MSLVKWGVGARVALALAIVALIWLIVWSLL
jgi:hypothetical protein